ncbi:hypothetical protein RQY65_08540, partial [Streptococcus pneumoniae]|nr:hypothetical protein [Streptococcus pneumoniae]MDS2605798.1 hypothetical protein [Streptococcus pneumoniae]MDS5038403.1 hypothetical protein [Streptococcus pneumoniae]MDS5258173.1 hypothetical protein [Streptococcus pneumoniae]MDS8075156.1 hypothetical protein [Streptococcus pneumoniae]
MKVNIADLHPTQLYLSEKKLQDIQMLYQSAETIQVDPIDLFGNCKKCYTIFMETVYDKAQKL